jgi:hypothetical protein
MLVRMDALQSTMSLLAKRVAVVEVAAQRHTDELHDIMQGFHANRGGVVVGPPRVGPMRVPHLAVDNPLMGPVCPYHFKPRPGTSMAQGNQVSPGRHLRAPWVGVFWL